MVRGYRAALLGRPGDWSDLAAGALWALGMAGVGAILFRTLKRGFADLL
jgi:ABC-type polysaccharide/polyol phosphate export permease